MDQLRNIFFQDAEEHLGELDRALTQIVPEHDCTETVNSIFRSVHTLKGDSGALGFESIEKLLHHFETHLDLLREGATCLTPNSADIFAMVVDCVEQLLCAEREGKPTPHGLDAAMSLLDELNRMAFDEKQASSEPPNAPVENEIAQEEDFGLFEEEADNCEQTPSDHIGTNRASLPFFGDFLIRQGLLTEPQLVKVLEKQRSGQPLIGKILLQSGNMSIKDVEATLQYQQDTGQLFGEAAVQIGLLEESALNAALSEQRRQRPSFRQTIVQLGYMDEELVADQFQRFTDAHPEAISAGLQLVGNTTVTEESEGSGNSAFQCDAELLAEFVSDSEEHLSIAEDQLLVIENSPSDNEALNAIYRSFHTVKGLSSFLGLEDTRNLAHQAESMLNMARDGKLTLSGAAFEVALSSVDGLKQQVNFAREWLGSQGSLQSDPRLPGLLSAIEAVINGEQPTTPPKQDIAESDKRVPERPETFASVGCWRGRKAPSCGIRKGEPGRRTRSTADSSDSSESLGRKSSPTPSDTPTQRRA